MHGTPRHNLVLQDPPKPFLLSKGEVAATNCSKLPKSKMEWKQDENERERWGKKMVA
jgi:hypothetical protein